jgi:hypothetical protein
VVVGAVDPGEIHSPKDELANPGWVVSGAGGKGDHDAGGALSGKNLGSEKFGGVLMEGFQALKELVGLTESAGRRLALKGEEAGQDGLKSGEDSRFEAPEGG